MGQFRNASDDVFDLIIGHPNPSTVKPDEVFTVDDDADESYSSCPARYGVVKSTWTAPPTAKAEEAIVPGPLRGEEALKASLPAATPQRPTSLSTPPASPVAPEEHEGA